MVSRIFDETPCFQFFDVKAHSRHLLDEVDAHGLDKITQEFASLSNNVARFKVVSFEEQAPMVGY